MSRTKNCIEMIKILSDGNTHGISELARRLETNPRNIVEYRKEISDAGYYIEPIPGRYGGYKMHKESMFPCLKLMPAERMALSVGTGYLAARKDFPYKEEYKSAMEKVFCSDNREVIPFNPTVIPRYPLVMNEVALKERYDIINKAINQKHKVKIEYRSNDNIIRERTIRPYMLYMYDNNWFVLAYCEMTQTYRYFKLCRISKLVLLTSTFRRSIAFDEKEWLDSFGMTNNGEWYDVKLKFTGKYAMVVQDYLYGKNQVTECVDSNTTILSLQMQYRDTIVGFVLSHGIYCEVLEPEWLKQEVKETAEKILKMQ